MLRAFLPGLVLGFFLAWAPSCGRPCTESNCLGCCTSEGLCAPGVNANQCGANGDLCMACAPSQTCTNSACVGPAGTGGGAGGGSPSGGGAGGGAGGGSGGGGGVVLDARLRLFVTSLFYTGNVGGLAGADAACRTAAQAANKGGTWKAWLSSSTENALDRMADVGPWYQEKADGTFVKTFNNKANLATSPLASIEVDEQGRDLNPYGSTTIKYWTGTFTGGTRSDDTCRNWTSSSTTSYDEGTYGAGTGDWTNSALANCAASHHLLCFEQSRDPRPAPAPTTRKRLFVTSLFYTGNVGGLAGADAACSTAAQAANKGGTWKAWLSSSTENALDRMADVGPWHQEKADGTFIKTFNNKANLATSPLASIEVDEQGRDLNPFGSANVRYWTGTFTGGTRSGNTCRNWTSSSTTSYDEGTYGDGTSDWTDSALANCAASHHLLCFEQ